MSSAPQSRETFKISDSLNRQLNIYAVATSAAGVSVLALAGASEAKVVYTETHQPTLRDNARRGCGKNQGSPIQRSNSGMIQE
jgi:hypothetical protein